MPVFFFTCPKCGRTDRQLLTPAGGRAAQKCRKTPGCDARLKRTPNSPSMKHLEVIDNGLMHKALERDIDSERMVRERTEKDYRHRE